MNPRPGREAGRRAPPPSGSNGVRVDVGFDGARGPLGETAIRAIVRSVMRAEGVRRASLSVTFCSDSAIRRLNTKYFGRRSATDVIAFALDDLNGVVTGDIYVAPDVAMRAASALDVPVREELVRLVVHGALHVLGYDHPAGESRVRSAMWRRQEELVTMVLKAGRRK